jgi:hypothetical protein
MSVAAADWLGLIEREYFHEFLPGGGAAVKFAVVPPEGFADVRTALLDKARNAGFLTVPIDAATTRLHLIQEVFFAISRSVDWEAGAQRWLETNFALNGYPWPKPGQPVPLDEIAATHDVDTNILRSEVDRWLTRDIMRDRELAQDFSVAIARLCRHRLNRPDDEDAPVVTPAIEWLRGELRTIGSVRQLYINQKITRHNARAMLRSLCRWLTRIGRPGVVVVADIRQLSRPRSEMGEGVKYTPASVLDAFEVLRQLIDDAERFEGLMFVGLADPTLLDGDPRRTLDAYRALKTRVWSDVQARGRDNPLSPLVTLGQDTAAGTQP